MTVPAPVRLAVLGALGAAGAGLWWRAHPSACPYGQRFWIQAPHPLITQGRLLEILAPVAGERILEVGPGTGYYSLTVAEALQSRGQLDIFDLQPKMLEHALHVARQRGLTNIVATPGDARELPFEDASFDAAYLVTVLGEIPDQQAALAECRRVLKPDGRLVIGELIGDPHFVSLAALGRGARAVGLRVQRRTGPSFGYFAQLVSA